MQVRRSTPDDQAELVKLLLDFEVSTQQSLSAPQAAFRAYSATPEEMEAVFEEAATHYLNDPDQIVFVADQDGKLEGFISGNVKIKEHRVYGKEGYIKNWFVRPEARSGKVGKQLMDAITKEFRQAGCTHLGLETYLENTDAIAIYKHLEGKGGAAAPRIRIAFGVNFAHPGYYPPRSYVPKMAHSFSERYKSFRNRSGRPPLLHLTAQPAYGKNGV